RKGWQMKLTPQQAIEQGYTHFVEFEGEVARRLEKLINGEYAEWEVSPKKKHYLCGKPQPFHISAAAIQDMLEDYLINQSEVNDENEVLFDELSKVDFDAIEKLVNVGFTPRWFMPEDIEVELDLSGLS